MHEGIDAHEQGTAEENGAVRPIPGDPGVVASEHYAARADRDDTVPLPRPPLPPPEPGLPPLLMADPPVGAVTNGRELAALAADAAHRAWELATGRGDGDLDLDEHTDLARRAHTVGDTPELRSMAERSGHSDRQLARLAEAWSHGGADALSVLDEGWEPPASIVEEAQALLLTEVPRVRRSGSHLSLPAGVQLRFSRSGRWYPCQRRDGDWQVIGRGDTDALAAYDTRT